MQGLILAAGMGRRLKDLTSDNTKCMIKVNGITLIERMLGQLDPLGLSRIIIVVGYQGHKLMDFIATLGIKTPIEYVENPIYDKTNNIYSLSLAKDYLGEEDTLLLESDLIFEDSVLQLLLEDPRETLALVDQYESWMDGTVLKVDQDDNIVDFIPGKSFKFKDVSSYYKTVNIYKFSRHFSQTHYVPFLNAYTAALGNNEYYEQVLRIITMLDTPEIAAKRLSGQSWYEIDDIQDLDVASSIFAPSAEEKLSLMQSRFGGYWRYPKVLDFCYLVNPYYPPKKMSKEIKSNFERLLTQYPSGMRVNALLAAKNFGVAQETIVVGNGAAELIKSIMEQLQGNIGFVRPTFEEYPNRTDPSRRVVFTPDRDDFRYTARDLMDYFDGQDVSALVVVNPDNPSGNYIQKSDLLLLAQWAEQKGITLLVDESFVDFSDEENSTLIDPAILEEFPRLIVVKSISKSYGVPGLRLGVAATAQRPLIAQIKKDVSIWNINSFAEYYMQIEEKYKKDYITAMDRFRVAREQYIEELQSIPNLRVYPTQANYVMAQVLGGISSRVLAEQLLTGYNLLIKDLSGKITRDGKQYIRIAVRTSSENRRLVSALRSLLEK